jgi:hypothetical protein
MGWFASYLIFYDFISLDDKHLNARSVNWRSNLLKRASVENQTGLGPGSTQHSAGAGPWKYLNVDHNRIATCTSGPISLLGLHHFPLSSPSSISHHSDLPRLIGILYLSVTQLPLRRIHYERPWKRRQSLNFFQ